MKVSDFNCFVSQDFTITWTIRCAGERRKESAPQQILVASRVVISIFKAAEEREKNSLRSYFSSRVKVSGRRGLAVFVVS